MKEDTIMLVEGTGIIKTTTNKKEDTMMMPINNKHDKLTLADAMTIINNASVENKFKLIIERYLCANYIVKIDSTNYIIYIPDDSKHIMQLWELGDIVHINKNYTYNFTVVSKSPYVLLTAERYNSSIRSKSYDAFGYRNINFDIILDTLDNPNKLELDDKKLRNILAKARLMNSLYDFVGGCGYTINNNNILWYIPEDTKMFSGRHKTKNLDKIVTMPEINKILDHIDIESLSLDHSADEITLNIMAISNKKIFNTDFIIRVYVDSKEQYVYIYVHNMTSNSTACQK